MRENQAGSSELINLADIAARTVTFNGAWLDIRKYEGDIAITLDVGTVSGTTPTLDGKIQDADDGSGTNAADLSPGATFVQRTASNASEKIAVNLNRCRPFIRFVGTIAGTTPSFTFGVKALATPKYAA